MYKPIRFVTAMMRYRMACDEIRYLRKACMRYIEYMHRMEDIAAIIPAFAPDRLQKWDDSDTSRILRVHSYSITVEEGEVGFRCRSGGQGQLTAAIGRLVRALVAGSLR
jgi:hypothetical protein